MDRNYDDLFTVLQEQNPELIGSIDPAPTRSGRDTVSRIAQAFLNASQAYRGQQLSPIVTPYDQKVRDRNRQILFALQLADRRRRQQQEDTTKSRDTARFESEQKGNALTQLLASTRLNREVSDQYPNDAAAEAVYRRAGLEPPMQDVTAEAPAGNRIGDLLGGDNALELSPGGAADVPARQVMYQQFQRPVRKPMLGELNRGAVLYDQNNPTKALLENPVEPHDPNALKLGAFEETIRGLQGLYPNASPDELYAKARELRSQPDPYASLISKLTGDETDTGATPQTATHVAATAKTAPSKLVLPSAPIRQRLDSLGSLTPAATKLHLAAQRGEMTWDEALPQIEAAQGKGGGTNAGGSIVRQALFGDSTGTNQNAPITAKGGVDPDLQAFSDQYKLGKLSDKDIAEYERRKAQGLPPPTIAVMIQRLRAGVRN